MAKSLGLPRKKDGLSIDVQTLLQSIQQAFLQEVESLRERRSNLESPAASSSGGEHPAVLQTLQEVLEFGGLPKEIKVAERKLAKRVRWLNFGGRLRQKRARGPGGNARCPSAKYL